LAFSFFLSFLISSGVIFVSYKGAAGATPCTRLQQNFAKHCPSIVSGSLPLGGDSLRLRVVKCHNLDNI
jgi:hypothetical protein